MNNKLSKMLAVMSDEDKSRFSQLSKKLMEQAKGEMSKLPEADQQVIAQLKEKYANEVAKAHGEGTQKSVKLPSGVALLETPFSHHVRRVLARHLGSEFSQEEEAITYAFENRWLPAEMKEEAVIDELFAQFELDIAEANQWREDIVPIGADKKMAVGIAWFSVIYQLVERIKK